MPFRHQAALNSTIQKHITSHHMQSNGPLFTFAKLPIFPPKASLRYTQCLACLASSLTYGSLRKLVFLLNHFTLHLAASFQLSTVNVSDRSSPCYCSCQTKLQFISRPSQEYWVRSFVHQSNFHPSSSCVQTEFIVICSFQECPRGCFLPAACHVF